MIGLVYYTNLNVILHVFTACQLASKLLSIVVPKNETVC
jgi:hypothetical protein